MKGKLVGSNYHLFTCRLSCSNILFHMWKKMEMNQ